MSLHPFGSITFVISEKHGEHSPIIAAEADELTDRFVTYFNSMLKKQGFEQLVQVTDVQYQLGCVTIVITLGTLLKIVAAGGTIAGGYKIFKDYKDFREGLDKFINDLKNIKVWIKRVNPFKNKVQKTPAVPAPEEDLPAADPLEIIIENVAEQYKSTPPELRKYIHIDQKVTVETKAGEYCRFTISVMREDIPGPKVEGKEPEKKEARKGSKKSTAKKK